MANSLLDFVMSLVRDPDAAARYAADPAGTIAEAQLTDVTSTDVDNLIPVVSESLSMTGPAGGIESFAAEPAGNVWASGAATAAFDAFGVPATGAVVDDPGPAIIDVIDHPSDPVLSSDLDRAADQLVEAPDPFDQQFSDAVPPSAEGLDDPWAQPLADDPPQAVDGGAFDLFD